MDLSTRQGRREQGQRIQRAVERAGLSVEELAGRIGCSRALIYQYLSGTTLAQPDRLQQIALECGVPLTYFYGDTAQIEPHGAPGTTTLSDSVTTSGSIVTPYEVTTRLNESLRALQELADAQENPPDYRALASTCERILSLAAQLGDRVAQARAQRRLGNAYLSIGDYPRAAEALTRAVTMATEAGEVESEISARQSLGKALMAMGRYPEAREQFTRVATGPVFSGRWRGTLSLGGLHTMFGEYQQAMQRFDEAATILDEGQSSGQIRPDEVAVGLLYINTNRRNVYLDGGDYRNARPLAEKGMADAEALGNADQHLEARFDLAWCDYCTGRWALAYRGLTSMLQLARFVGEQGFETMSRAWLGIFLAAAGDFESAIGYGKDALALALSRGDRRGELYGQLALADAYTGQTVREGEARYHTNQALAVTTAMRHDRGEIECRLRLSRLSGQIGDLTEMRAAAARAVTIAQRLGARHLESLARCWMAAAMLREQQVAAGPVTETGNPKSKNPAAKAQSLPAELAAARQEAETALEIAQDIEMIEARWRARDLLAQIALAEQPANSAAAEGYLRAALADLDALRAGLIESGLPDTLLENEDCAAVYGRLARTLRQSGRAEEADAFLDQTGWPPLTARLAAESGRAAE